MENQLNYNNFTFYTLFKAINVFYNIWNDDVNSVFLIGEEND